MRKSFKLYKENMFNFSGRATRPEYWWMVLCFTILTLVVASISVFVITLLERQLRNSDIPIIIYIVCLSLFVLTVYISYIALVVRRLHDTNHSGLYYLIRFVPVISVVSFILTLLPSKEYDNDYGKYEIFKNKQ